MSTAITELTERERDVLEAVVTLHEAHGGVVTHGGMAEPERQAVDNLVLLGLLERRKTSKESTERIVVPTPLGRELVAA